MRHDPSVTAPTELFVPRLHYPHRPQFDVSSGQVEYDATTQVATWNHSASDGEHTLIIMPMPAQ